MTTDVDICNSALLKLGQGTGNLIAASLSEDSRNARLCDALYAKKRDELLRGHVWNFAVTRAALSRDPAAPAFAFDHAYNLPADWIRTVSVFDNEQTGTARYRLEGRRILSDAETLYLVYIRRVTDPNAMPPDFREALATLLAWDLALPIADSNSLADRMERRHLRALRLAKSSDALEDGPARFPAGSWVEVR